MRFYLGTHMTCWLARTDIPMFVSHRRLSGVRSLPRAKGEWALDSGGFTEISMYGSWKTSPREYADAVYRYRDAIGGLQWAAIQDWMCEPFMVEKTGRSVKEHQELTISSYLQLRDLAPDLDWVPVLQGWKPDDYLSHLDAYSAAGVDLRSNPLVGVGSVCRRQATDEAGIIFASLYYEGLKLHGFGLKTQGLAKYAMYISSADSLAWSYRARKSPPLTGCPHKSCANCLRFATEWYFKIIRKPCMQERALFYERTGEVVA
ncbi:DUF7221 family queuine tRNA-ribosyltransferase-like protein [Singulisphaera sp. PoT]|uniref:deazapurine DNA modification protein DpdA family protein n=1 Tax=Singulisphaera sp. PoT TaxID=3411797 RepID=UPI003BF51A30